MPTRILFDFEEVTVEAQLLTETAPAICRRVLQCLPVNTFAVHAKFAGEELITMVPFYAEPENEILDVKPGDIGYYPGRQTFCLFYGKVAPFGKVSVFASVIDSLEKLKVLGSQVLEQGSLPLRIRNSEEMNSRFPPGVVSSAGAPAGYSDLAFLEEFQRSIWGTPPPDLSRLKRTSRPPMGNLPCVFYACFNLFWLGEELQVARQMARDQSLPLQSIQKMTSELLLRHAGRLEKWEMTESCQFLRKMADSFSQQVKSYEDYLSTADHALVAVDRVQSWVDATIPWARLDSQLLRS